MTAEIMFDTADLDIPEEVVIASDYGEESSSRSSTSGNEDRSDRQHHSEDGRYATTTEDDDKEVAMVPVVPIILKGLGDIPDFNVLEAHDREIIRKWGESDTTSDPYLEELKRLFNSHSVNVKQVMMILKLNHEVVDG